jgi:uncharacterized protein involved in exopolysaccharide biosynthesis
VNLGKNHPQYQRMESEVAALKQRLEEETRHVASSYSTASNVGQSKESELKAAIEAQKQKLLTLRSRRDELEVLQRDVDAATRSYEAIANRFNQTTLESQSNRTNVSWLTPALPPREPSFPKPPRVMLLISIAIGIAVAVGAAYVAEVFDRRIRSADDLAEMLQLPVLGVIDGVKTRGRLSFPGAARRRLR